MKNIKSNTLNKFKHHVYFQVRNELSVENNTILKGQSIEIPKALQHHILSISHSQHQGIIKTKALLRENVWWSGMNADVENLIISCHACQVTTPAKTKSELIQMTEIPASSWVTVVADLKGPFPTGENLLVILD